MRALIDIAKMGDSREFRLHVLNLHAAEEHLAPTQTIGYCRRLSAEEEDVHKADFTQSPVFTRGIGRTLQIPILKKRLLLHTPYL